MPEIILAVCAIVLAGVVGSLSAMAGQMYERRKWVRRLEEHGQITTLDPTNEPTRESRESRDRLTRLEQAVEAIAIEMERVGEGQRFVTKLLAERRPERDS